MGLDGADDPPRARLAGEEDPPPVPIEAEISEARGKNPISARGPGREQGAVGERDGSSRTWNRDRRRGNSQISEAQQPPRAAGGGGAGRGKQADERETRRRGRRSGDDDGAVKVRGIFVFVLFWGKYLLLFRCAVEEVGMGLPRGILIHTPPVLHVPKEKSENESEHEGDAARTATPSWPPDDRSGSVYPGFLRLLRPPTPGTTTT